MFFSVYTLNIRCIHVFCAAEKRWLRHALSWRSKISKTPVLKTRPVLEIEDLKDPEGAGRVLGTVSACAEPVFLDSHGDKASLVPEIKKQAMIL